MALRVLLADESTTIKKVMQLALQDFAVEVKAVHVGVDVVEVARQFQPDIIFADVLLQKRNGYEVCGDLKADPQLKSTPVVLMWSSFMDLDEALAKNSGADRRLEKPFDIENLRTLLLELVPKTHTQRLAHFLKFPASFSEPLKSEEAKKQETQAGVAPAAPSRPPPAAPRPAAPVSTAPPPPPPKAPAPQPKPIPTSRSSTQSINRGIATSMPHPPPSGPPHPPKDQVRDGTKEDWNMDSFEDISKFEPPALSVAPDDAPIDDADDADDEVFSELRLQGPQRHSAQAQPSFDAEATATREIPMPSTAPQDDSDEAWSHQDLSRFKIEMPPVTASNPEYGIEIELPDENADMPMQPRAFEQHSNVGVQPLRSDTIVGDHDFGGGEVEEPLSYEMPDLGMSGGGDSDNDLLLGQDEINASDLSIEPSDEFQYENPNQRGGLQLTSLEDESDEQQEPTFRIENPLPPRGARRESRGGSGGDSDFPVSEVGAIPQLSPERLEQIIRAQTREIVESVVRKIVPDLATDIIREELQRLLEDTSIRDPRRDNY